MDIEHDEKVWEVPEYAKILRAARMRKKVKQEDLAKRLGVSTMAISHYESGNRTPRIDKFQEWATQLGFAITISLKEKGVLAPKTKE